jgi:diacylglycerol kinase family enzyme
MTATAVVIGNTRSGAALERGETLLRQLTESIQRGGRNAVTLPFPEVATDARTRSELMQNLDAGADRVYVLGGDGTVRTVAQLLLGRDVPLGIVPAGTANLLARDLTLPAAPEQAIDALAEARVRHIDVARCNGAIFLCAAMFGMSTDLARAREAARGLGARHMLPQLLRKAYWVLKR